MIYTPLNPSLTFLRCLGSLTLRCTSTLPSVKFYDVYDSWRPRACSLHGTFVVLIHCRLSSHSIALLFFHSGMTEDVKLKVICSVFCVASAKRGCSALFRNVFFSSVSCFPSLDLISVCNSCKVAAR